MCYAITVGDSQTNECKDTQFCTQNFISFGMYLRLHREQGIEVVDELRKKGDKSLVEICVEGFFFFCQVVYAMEFF